MKEWWIALLPNLMQLDFSNPTEWNVSRFFLLTIFQLQEDI